jgi:hypothetical protein
MPTDTIDLGMGLAVLLQKLVRTTDESGTAPD